MKIEVYGIDEKLGLPIRCSGCINTTRYLDMQGYEYTLYPVLLSSDNELGFDYDRERIKELAKRAKFPSLSIQYPQVFIDDEHIGGYRDMRQYIDSLNSSQSEENPVYSMY